jgi:hypothetical protein
MRAKSSNGVRETPYNRLWKLRCRFVPGTLAELKLHLQVIRRESAMAVAALKNKSKLKTFHATVHVTRVEEWYVEAESPEQARDLLAAGAGCRCQIGECLNLEIERLEE